MELDRDLARTIDLENAWRHVTVERKLRIGVVVNQQDVEIAAAGNDVLEIVERRDGCRWIVGIVQVQNPRARQNVARDFVQID